MPPEVVSAIETTIEVLNPIDMTTLQTVTFSEDVSISERPVYAMRGVARSGARNAPIQMSAGQVTMRRTVDTAAVYEELRRWRYGVLQFSLTTDLRGRRLRHPHIRITKRNADGVTVEQRVAYDCKLSDYTLSKPAVGLVGESFTIESQGGIDTPGADHYEPTAPIALFRTGPKNYAGTAGTLTTAADGAAAYGLPYVARRNLYANSVFNGTTGWTLTNNATMTVVYDPSTLPSGYPAAAKIAQGTANAIKVTMGSDGSGSIGQQVKVVSGVNQKINVWVYVPSSWTGTFRLWFAQVGTYAAYSSQDVVERDQWVNKTINWTPGASVDAMAMVGCAGGSVAGKFFYVAAPHCEPLGAGSSVTYQATNASGVDVASLAGAVLEGAGTNHCANNTFANTTGWIGSSMSTVASLVPGKSNALQKVWSGQFDTVYFAPSPALTPGAVYTVSFVAKNTVPGVSIWFQDINNNVTYGTWVPTGGTDYLSFTFTAPASPGGNWGFKVGSAGAGTVTIDAVQLEPGHLQTSLILTNGSTGTRQPDLCGLASPHNLLKRSEALATSPWTTANVTRTENDTTYAPPVTGMAVTKLLGTVADSTMFQTLDSTLWTPGKTYTFSIWLRSPTPFTLRIYCGESGSTWTTISIIDAWQRFSFTRTTATSAATLFVQLGGANTFPNGTALYASGAQIVEGFHPGVYVRTTDLVLRKPIDGGMDLAWSQNGFIEWDSVNPPNVANTTAFYHLGSGLSGYPGLYRYQWGTTTQSAVITRRAMDGNEPGAFRDVGSVPSSFYSGAKVRSRLEWSNYTLNGVRYMWLKLTIDGVVLYNKNFAADIGATTWTPVTDASTLISGGIVNAVVSNVVIGLPPLPAGAIPYGRAA